MCGPTSSPLLFVLRTEEEYQRLVVVLDSLVDRVGDDEFHPLASLVDVQGALVERYER